jgi:hypothetical protein
MHKRLLCSLLLCAVSNCVQVISAASLAWVQDMPFTTSWPAMRIQKWTHGILIDVQNASTPDPLIWLFGRGGTRSVPFSIAGAERMNIYDWDQGPDGTIGLSGSAVDTAGRASGFVGWISPGGTTSNITRTLLYRPQKLAVASDGTLWAAGSEYMPSSDLGIIRHFDKFGKLVGSFLPQSTIRDGVVLVDHNNHLVASKDRIAWYSPRAARYVEISLAGTLLTDISLKAPGNVSKGGYGLALSDDNDLFLSVAFDQPVKSGVAAEMFGVFCLERSSQSWKLILQRSALPPASQPTEAYFGHIYGVDGNQLVLSGSNRVRFYKISD